MLRAMDSAVSGLRAHQNKLDVIGHNLANVNTVGYKSQSYTFKDTMYQSANASTNGTTDSGGVNAAQYGYGSLMGTISIDMAASTPTYVGGFSATIDGNGFFVTKSTKEQNFATTGVAASDTTKIKNADFDFTRVGQFKVDSNGYIVDGNGNFVYGYQEGKPNQLVALRIPLVTETANTTATPPTIDSSLTFSPNIGAGTTSECTSIKINKAGNIEATLTYNGIKYDTDANGNQLTTTSPAVKSGVFTIGTVAIVTFQNQEGLTKDGSNYYKASESDNTGECSADVPGSNRATLMPGYLEASNVDMAVEFSEMIMAERGFQANSKMITVSDEILSDLISMKR
ncbi:MAG: flagellar hook-basal body complex protein [Lachnospiraceae bacterium]|nr:flagellar hook-basal body complex protein [Lachnospiraceae bacterium]